MATKHELLQIEKAIEDAFKVGLDAEIATGTSLDSIDTFVSSSDADLVAPRIELLVNDVSAEETLSTLWGNQEYLRFKAVMSVTLVTDYRNGGTRDNHHEFLGHIREHFLRNGPLDFSTLLPVHNIRDVRLTSTARQVEDDLQITELTYQLVIDPTLNT
jgi:hypothetical protein